MITLNFFRGDKAELLGWERRMSFRVGNYILRLYQGEGMAKKFKGKIKL